MSARYQAISENTAQAKLWRSTTGAVTSTIVLVGQALTHSPQLVQSSGSILARLLAKLMALAGQALTHLVQPMQPVSQFRFTTGPFWVLRQFTRWFFPRGTMLMSFLGQTATHFSQLLQLSS
jgi:hypothetical protein